MARQPSESDRKNSRRKVNGEGNIRQRSDGRREGRAWVFTSDGREIRKSVYGATWEEAHEKLTALKAKAQAGVRVAGSIQSVADFMAYWQREVLKDRVRPSTFRTYEWLSRCYVVPLIGNQRLGKLQPPTIRTFLNRAKSTCQCCAQGKDAARVSVGKPARCCALKPRRCCESYPSDGTIRHLHRMIRVALQDAMVDGLIAENPARNLRLNHRYRPRFTPLTGEEAKLLLKTARSDRLYALYAVALALGLRWQDVDLVEGIIFVRQSLQRLGGKLVFGPVKSDESERAIGIPGPCLAALRQHKATQEAERKTAGDDWQDFGLVFTTGIGTPIEPRNLNRHFVRLLERAGLRRVRFHDLRHSYATLLYEQGVPIERIQDVLGHSSPTITKLIYVEVTRQAQRSTTDKLGYLFDA